jgi:hypothetical protein
MSRVTHLQPEFVEFMPESFEGGALYISRRYSTASHLCCCGCGLRVVTPLNPAKWSLSESNGTVSLHPSIGNWSFPCKSHYWIVGNGVHWARAMSPAAIAEVRARDRRDARLLARESWLAVARRLLRAAWVRAAEFITPWRR